MRVLWFSNTSSLYKDKNNHHYYGGGWISSLQELIIEQQDITLGVCFLHATDSEKVVQEKTTYYPVLNKKKSALKKLYNNWTAQIEPVMLVQEYLKVIADFKPDIIQIFGTEGSFGLIQQHTSIPVVVHIQGVLNPYENAWFPPGISQFDILSKGSKLANILKGNSKWFDFRKFKKMAARERSYFPHTKNLMGRTRWVKEITELLMPQANYFEINEVLRPTFYQVGNWAFKKEKNAVTIVSTISSSTYKGLDQVLKTAGILKAYSDIKFEWHVYGILNTDSIISLMEKKFELKFNEVDVIFKGTIPAEKLINVLLSADVYVHPSYIETGCISISEAQILGLPVIACYIGGLFTTITDNETGLLVPANDPYNLASRIVYLAKNEDVATRLSINAKAAANTRHNKDKILSDVVTAYKTIINN